MTLQNVFYVVGIISMTLYTVLLVALVVLLLIIKRKVSQLQERLSVIKEIAVHPRETMLSLGTAVADTVMEKAEKIIRRKR